MTPVLYNIALVAVLAGISVPGIVLAVRALPPVDRRVLAGQRPWACDVCMSFWATGVVAGLVALVFKDARLLLSAGPAYTIALGSLAWLTRAPDVGVGVPPLEEGLAEALEPPRAP
jgi:hypothetical protein